MAERIFYAREACLNSLVRFEKEKKYSNIELNNCIEKYNLSELDRKFFTKLFYGVIEKKLTLDFYIGNLSEKKNKDPFVVNILRLGLYQILYMDKIPESAVCDESVKLAKNLKNIKAAGYINAVLRNFLRKREELEDKLNKLNDLEIKYSCSSDIIRIWTESYGKQTAEKILEASAKKQGFTITVNSLKISRDEYAEHIDAEYKKINGYGVNILEDLPVKNLYGYHEGLFFVQDEASQICAEKTDAAPGDLIVDCCAAPGGKSFFMAQMMQNKGKIICLDIHKNKLKLINNSAKNLGIDIIETYECDAALKLEKLEKSANAVLCDVPCSGLGVIGKKPEIKYKTLNEISRLPDLQYKILSTCANYVKPGGVLIYSTCTLNKKENEEITEKFLDTNKCFEQTYSHTFFPFERNIDGFFLAKMKRTGI